MDRPITTVLENAISEPDKWGANRPDSRVEGSVIQCYASITIDISINHLIVSNIQLFMFNWHWIEDLAINVKLREHYPEEGIFRL
jgi:hypothetical protein